MTTRQHYIIFGVVGNLGPHHRLFGVVDKQGEQDKIFGADRVKCLVDINIT